MLGVFAFILLANVATSVAVIACTGPEGPQGPAGPAGPAGPEGPEASNESATQPSFEVWAVDQSSTTSYGGGGLIYIWDGADISANASEATPEIITKAKKLGVNLVVNPSFIYQNGFRYSQRIPKMLQPYTFNYRTLLDSGFNLAIGSDAPYGNLDPLINIQSMVNRKDQLGNTYNGNQAISIIESVWLITEGVNNVSTEEIIFAKPSVGDKANIVILNQNLQNIDHTNVHKLAIDVVIKDGFRILS